MRLAFKTSPQHTTWSDMLDVWRAGDQIDAFESGWTFDHFYPIFSDPDGPCLEGWTTLSALAQATSRVRVGVLVTGGEIGAAYLTAVFLSNLPEGISSTSGLLKRRWS